MNSPTWPITFLPQKPRRKSGFGKQCDVIVNWSKVWGIIFWEEKKIDNIN